MASFKEIAQAASNGDLQLRARVATYLIASDILTEPVGTANHAKRRAWAQDVMVDPQGVGNEMLWAAIATYRTASFVDILGVTDEGLHTAINEAMLRMVT